MLIKTKIVLTVAIVFSTTFTAATAATRHRRVAPVSSGIYNVLPGNVPNNVSLSTACLPTDSPCRTKPDSLVARSKSTKSKRGIVKTLMKLAVGMVVYKSQRQRARYWKSASGRCSKGNGAVRHRDPSARARRVCRSKDTWKCRQLRRRRVSIRWRRRGAGKAAHAAHRQRTGPRARHPGQLICSRRRIGQ